MFNNSSVASSAIALLVNLGTLTYLVSQAKIEKITEDNKTLLSVSQSQCHVQLVHVGRYGLTVRFKPSIPNAAVITAYTPKFEMVNYRAPVTRIIIPFGGRAMTSHIANTQCLLVPVRKKRKIGLDVDGFRTGVDGRSVGSTEFIPARTGKIKLRTGR